MTINLTQKGMISTFTANVKGDFYWRLKYPCQHQGNPEDETALTAKHKRVSPIQAFARREHEHFIFLAVTYQKYTSHTQWVGDFLYSNQLTKIISCLKSRLYNFRAFKN